MRIRRLLFLLSPILLGGATPVHAALGIEPRRLPPAATQGAMDTVDAKLPIPELAQTVPNYEPEERDYLIRTIAFEAADESDEGKAAVAHVILNRKRSGRWGDNIKDVVMHPWQFEPWMTRRKEMEKLSPDDPRYQGAARVADAVLTGQMPDPTAGATHFVNPTVVRQRRGGSLPSWARGEGQPIGRHTFYSPNENGAALEPPAVSMGALGDPLRFDTSSQPLTRADCGKAGMLWNEGANVCTESPSTAELSLNLFQAPKVRVTTTGGGALAALGESTKSGESLAAVHKPEITPVESPAKVETAAPPIPAKPKTAKSPTPSRPNVAAAKASSKSKHVKSGGSRGRAVAARSSTKSSVKTVSKSSVKSAAKSTVRTVSKSSVKSASRSSVKSPSKSSVKTAAKSRSTHGRVAAASKRSARARIAAASAANPHWAYQLQSSDPKNRL
jgi:spore germination cell wall hydrolase CwlJ-like protein